MIPAGVAFEKLTTTGKLYVTIAYCDKCYNKECACRLCEVIRNVCKRKQDCGYLTPDCVGFVAGKRSQL